MYRTIRSIHLCAGLFSLIFLVVYAVSAVQMTHPWFRVQARTSERAVVLPANLTDAREAARALAASHGIWGELTGIRSNPSGLSFRILRPGMVWQADYTASSGTTRLRTTDSGVSGALNRIHQMRGIWHSWMAYNIWAALLALVGLAILTLGASGLYLWWKTHKDRRLTGVLLASSVAIIGGLAAWMRIAG